MSHITHFKLQPVNIQYWDYYILCHLKPEVAIALQRLEYWDKTKEDGNAHAEDINEELIKAGKEPTQDTSRWIYKAQDELLWELMGVTGEKKLPQLIKALEELNYLVIRNNPHNTWDRKKQYELQAILLQDHLNYLGYIVSFFNLPLRRMRPVFCTIESLTKNNMYIDRLNVESVLEAIEDLKTSSKVPHFLKTDIEKFEKSFVLPSYTPFRSFAEWKAQFCGMHSAILRNRNRNSAESIPQNRGSNSIEDNTENTNKEDKHSSSYSDPNLSSSLSAATLSSSQLKNLSLEDLVALKAEIDTLVSTEQGNNPETHPLEKIAPADTQNSQEDQKGKEMEEERIETIERPAADAPRTAEMIVRLVEFLRGQRFERRGEQLKAAAILLGIEPALSLAEIEEAWAHGSDDYWRERDPLGMTVADLQNKEKSSGKYRVLACLEHKRRFEREQGQRRGQRGQRVFAPAPQSVPSVPSVPLSEAQTQAILEQIAQDARGYDVQASVVQGDGKVSIVWRSPYWPKKRDVIFSVRSCEEWQREFSSWREILQMRVSEKGALHGSH